MGFELTPIDFLNLTGRSKGVSAVGAQHYTPAAGGNTEEGGVTSGRALDRAPRAEKFAYEEYTNPGTGRKGISTWSLYA